MQKTELQMKTWNNTLKVSLPFKFIKQLQIKEGLDPEQNKNWNKKLIVCSWAVVILIVSIKCSTTG